MENGSFESGSRPMTRGEATCLIRELGKVIALPDMAFDEHGFVCLLTEEGIAPTIDLYEDQECLVMQTTVGEIPEGLRLTLYDEMLKTGFM